MGTFNASLLTRLITFLGQMGHHPENRLVSKMTRLRISGFLLLPACGPIIDPPPLELAQCSAEDSPTELARVAYDPDNEYETFDLIDAITVAVDPVGGDPVTHLLVDNCAGDPLRLARTFDYRPGAAYVGGQVVLCSGGLGGPEGVWELLEDGTAGRDLGLACGAPTD